MPRLQCKVGDTLRVLEDGWVNYPPGSEGIVIEIARSEVAVKVTKARNPKYIGSTSFWSYDGPKILVIPGITDEQVEQTKKELAKLLKVL